MNTEPTWVYNIETQMCGIWDVWDTATSLEDALMLASSLAETLSEERIRIEMPGGWFL